MRRMASILVVGETEVCRIALRHLQRAGYSVSLLGRARDALRRARELYPALIVIDAVAIRGQAVEVCQSIRRLPSLNGTQLILIAAQASEEDRLLGFESGADDYISGPFSGLEFVARTRAVLRRLERPLAGRNLETQAVPAAASSGVPLLSAIQSSSNNQPRSSLEVGDIEINARAMRLAIDGREIPMTALEFRLIHYLAENQPRVFTRDQLLDAVWGDNQFVTPRTVDAAIRRIRKKIEPQSSCPVYLKTVRGVGYRLDRAMIRADGSSLRLAPAAYLAS